MKVAILGFGTVGVGVYEMLEKCAGLEPGPVLVRPGKADKPFKVTSVEAIVDDPSVGAVAEVMGGIEPANTYVAMALKACCVSGSNQVRESICERKPCSRTMRRLSS